MISRASKLIGGAAALALIAACSSGADADRDPSVDPIPVATNKPETGGNDIQTEETPEVTDTGDVQGELGEPIGLAGGGDEAIFTLTVNSIEHADTCPSRIDPVDVEPEGEDFLVFDISAEMSEDYSEYLDDGEEPFLTIAPDAFYLTDLNGVIQADVITVASHECFALEDQPAPFINPGETASGLIALDTSLDHGYLVYNPWGVDGSGWTWEF